MECVELEHREMKGKGTKETHGFKIKNLCVYTGYREQKDEQPTISIKMEE